MRIDRADDVLSPAAARKYQIEGARFIATQLSRGDNRACGLLDDAGLGKTLQALMAADQLGAQRILAVGPAISRISWGIEVQKFAPHRFDNLHVVQPGEAPGRWLTDESVMAVLSYDVFSQRASAALWLPRLKAQPWDFLILDEAQYLKTPASNRTRAIYGFGGLLEACSKVLLMSGTLCPNHAGEFYSHYRALWPDLLRYNDRPLHPSEFQDKFCVVKYTPFSAIPQVIGSKNQAELREMFAPVMLRRTKRAVLPELPPLTIQDVPISAPVRDAPEVRAIAQRFGSLDDETLLAVLHQDNAHLSTARRLLGERKAVLAAEWIAERLDFGVPKFLVFAWHSSVIRTLATHLAPYSPVTVQGANTPRERSDAVTAFQTDPRHRVLIGQILAAGSAITLTAAADVAIVEPSWTPGENQQAIARAHRMGQQQPVTASFLYLPGSLDRAIMGAFRRKAEELEELTDESV